jgi:anti-anti-sigma factor
MAITHDLSPFGGGDRSSRPVGSAGLSYTVRPTDDPPGTRVVVTGEVDLSTADDLLSTLCAIATVERATLSLDLAGVEFFDCTGLRVVAEIERTMRLTGGRLAVCNPRPLVARLLVLSELEDTLAVA